MHIRRDAVIHWCLSPIVPKGCVRCTLSRQTGEKDSNFSVGKNKKNMQLISIASFLKVKRGTSALIIPFIVSNGKIGKGGTAQTVWSFVVWKQGKSLSYPLACENGA